MMILLGVDAGNHTAKVAGAYGVDSYRTAICDWFKRDIVETHGSDDMEFEIDGRKGFAGTIAVYEDEFGGIGMYGDSKAHEDTKIRVLLAVHRYINKYCPGVTDVSLITGQPIKSHNETDKNKIINMLEGAHNFVVNGIDVHLKIHGVAVGAEGSGAYMSNPHMGTVRVIDVGSGTVNCATVIDGRFINNASGTFNFGMETVNNKEDLDSVARGIVRGTTKLKWNKNDTVYVCGGIARDILPYISDHYNKADTLQPLLESFGGVTVTDPVYANAIGFYNIAEKLFR